MKVLKFFFIVVIVLGLTACNSDDDASTLAFNVENLTGTYEVFFLEGTYQETETASNGSEVIIETETYVGDTFTDYNFNFSANGTYTESGSYRETSTLTINGQTSTDSEIIIVDIAGSFSVNTNSRTLTLDGNIYDVTLFDAANLHITSAVSITSDDETSTEVVTIRMRRIN